MAAAPVPRISHEELLAFARSHFSASAVEEFGRTFTHGAGAWPSLGRQGGERAGEGDVDDADENDDDDALGFYDDGVKRTLTDEQIEIFRHSELREMRRQGEQQDSGGAAERRDGGELLGGDSAARCSDHEARAEERMEKARQDTKKRKKVFPKRGPRGEPKPDLRKRTWDVVEAGVDRLEYD